MSTPLAPGARLVLAVVPVAALAALAALALSGSAQAELLGDPGAWVRWGGPVLGAANHLAAAVVLGTLVLLLGVLPYRGGRAAAWRRAMTMLAWAAPVWAVLNLADVLLRYARAAGRAVGGAEFGQELAYYLTELSAGRASMVATVLIGLAAVVSVGITSYRGVALAAVPAFAVLVPWSVRGHAGSAADHGMAISAMWLHLVSVSVWVGGLVVLCLLARTLREHTADVMRRYSTVALWCFVLVGVSGLASGWLRLNEPGDLTGRYGGLLVAKAVTFTALGALGWWHRRRTVTALSNGGSRVGAFWRLAGGESLLMGTVIGVSAVLAVTPTPVPDTLPYVPAPAEELSGRPVPPPPQAGTWLTQVDPDVLLATGVVALAVVYLAGARRVGRQAPDQPWPRRRTGAFLTGVAVLGWVIMGGPAVYGQVMFSAHLVVLVTITFVVPALWAMGAPVSLALQALPPRSDDSRGPREYLLAMTGSRAGRFLARPVVTIAALALSWVVFHATGLFDLALTTQIGLVLMLVHFSALGYLFVTIFLPTDPALRQADDGRPTPVPAVALGLLASALLAVGVVVLARMDRLLAADYFGALGLPWGVDALADQRAGALVLGLLGGIPMLAFIAVAARVHRAGSQALPAAIARDGLGSRTTHDDGGAGPHVLSPAAVRREAPTPDEQLEDAEARAYARMLARRDRGRR